MARRLVFGIFFFLGTVVAIMGWLGGFATLRFTTKFSRSLAIGGHLVQIVSVIGAMLVPDDERYRGFDEHEADTDDEFSDDRM